MRTFICVASSQQRTKKTLEAISLKYQGRPGGGIFIPILQLGKVSANEVKLLAKGHPEVRASEKQTSEHRADVMCWVDKTEEEENIFCVWAYLKRKVLLWVSQFHLFSKQVPDTILDNEDTTLIKTKLTWCLQLDKTARQCFKKNKHIYMRVCVCIYIHKNVLGEKCCEEDENIVRWQRAMRGLF